MVVIIPKKHTRKHHITLGITKYIHESVKKATRIMSRRAQIMPNDAIGLINILFTF